MFAVELRKKLNVSIRQRRSGRLAFGMCAGRVAAAAAFVIAAPGLASQASAAQPAQCGQSYVVERGDTLFEIAQRAYGDGWLYKAVFKANADVLPNEAAVETGVEIFLPCFESAGPQTRKDAAANGLLISEPSPIDFAEFNAARSYMAGTDDAGSGDAVTNVAETDTIGTEAAEIDAGEVIAALSYPAGFESAEIDAVTPDAEESGVAKTGDEGDGALRALSAPGLGMSVGESLNGGDMMTKMLDRAAVKAGLSLRPKFDANRTAHLDLLTQGAVQISYPWVRPDCEGGASLDPVSLRLCTEFTFSAPVLELSAAFFVHRHAGNDRPQTHAELAGLTLCRPDGEFSLSLVLASQMEEVTAANPTQCFVDLMLGAVDVVAIDRAEARKIFDRLDGVESVIEEVEALALSRTAHAIAPTARADALTALSLVDRGLRELMISGEWFEIMSAHQRGQLAQLN